MPYSARLEWAPVDGAGAAGQAFRVRLPPDALDELSRDAGVVYPLTFELRAPATGAKTYAGVAEFSAPPGRVLLPPPLADALGLAGAPAGGADSASGVVVVTYARLPRAAAVTLRALTPGFTTAVPDHRAALEHALRDGGVTALHAGLVLTVSHEGADYPLIVTRAEPATAPAVVTIDTDCDVELEGATTAAVATAASADGDDGDATMTTGPSTGASSSSAARPADDRPPAAPAAAVPLPLGQPVSAAVAAGAYRYFSVRVPPEPAGGDGSSSSSSAQLLPVVELRLQPATAPTAELDLYAGIAPLSRPSLARHDAAADVALPDPAAGRTLRVPLPPGAPGQVFVGVTAYGGAGGGGGAPQQHPFTLTAAVVWEPQRSAAPTAAAAAAPLPASEPEPLPPGTARCGNCGAAVPTGALTLHSATCARNNVRCAFSGCGALLRRGPAAAAEHTHCDGCGDVMPAGAVAKHKALYHTGLPCPEGCGAPPLRQAALSAHLRDACPLRWTTCRYCGASVRAGAAPRDHGDRLRGLTEHESYCGSRTAPCGGCRQPVPLKLHEAHWGALHPGQAPLPPALDALPPPPPPLAPTKPPTYGGSAASSGWVCGACSYVNPLPPSAAAAAAGASAACGMCGSIPPASAASGAASARAAAPCRNQACPATASRHGDAADLGLCSDCFRSFGAALPHPHHDDDGNGGDDALLARYNRQLTDGCGRPGCRNVHCATGARNSGSSGGGGSPFGADAPSHAAWLLQEAQPPSNRYYVCVAGATSARATGWSRSGASTPVLGASSADVKPRSSTASSIDSLPGALGGAAPATAGGAGVTVGAAAPRPASATGGKPPAPGDKRRTGASRVAGAFF